MPIRHCIVHLIDKKPDGTPAVLHARDTELAESAAIENMLADLNESYNAKQGKAWGFFHAESGAHPFSGWLSGERWASPKSRQVYRTIGRDGLRRVFWAPSDGPYAFFSRFRAIKLTKWVGRSGYFPVSVLVLPRLTPSLGVKRAFSICQVEPIPVSSIYNPDLRGYGRGCQAMTVGLDG